MYVYFFAEEVGAWSLDYNCEEVVKKGTSAAQESAEQKRVKQSTEQQSAEQDSADPIKAKDTRVFHYKQFAHFGLLFVSYFISVDGRYPVCSTEESTSLQVLINLLLFQSGSEARKS